MKKIVLVFAIILFNTAYVLPQPYLDQLQQDIDGADYWRLTRSVTEDKIDRSLFSRLGASEWVRIRDNHNGYTYDFSVRIATDPGWQRIIFADYNRTIKSYGDHAGEASFYKPNGVSKGRVWFSRYSTWNDYSVRLYIADSGNNRIVELRMWMTVIGTHQGGNEYVVSMEYMREFTGGGAFGNLNYPMDVAYLETGSGSSFTDDFLWVTDTGNHRVVKIRLSDGEIIESYGQWGSSNGKFIYPTHLSIYNNDLNSKLYVVDSGNNRLAKIRIGQVSFWEHSKSYSGRYLYGVCADPFGGGVWATDGLNHKLVRYDRYLTEIFDYGSYGLGQSPDILNTPVDISRYSIDVVESNNGPIYKDLLFATEKWSGGSGQTHYRSQPRYIENSFDYHGIWEDPGGGIGIHTEKNISQSLNTDEYLSGWLGTRFSFNVSDICYLQCSIYDRYQTGLVRNIWALNHLTMPGKVVMNWNGKDHDGEKYLEDLAYLKIRMESIYDPQLVLNYSFAFNPHTSEESAKASLSKVSGENNIPEVFEVLPN